MSSGGGSCDSAAVESLRLAGDNSGLRRIPVPDAQGRVEAILNDPDGYFVRARAEAWREATAEVDAELAARAHARAQGNGYANLGNTEPG